MVSGSKNNCTPDKIRRRQRRKWSTDWKKLRIDNDFIFCKVMQDKSLLTELIHLILPDLPFKELNIITQKSEEIGLDIHGIRLDVHARDEYGNLYDLEMQNRKMGHGDIPKRLRYYGSVTDANMLDRKKQYWELKNSYIIMICNFDQYKKGLHRYTFTNICKEDETVEMNDGSKKIFLNTKGTADDIQGTLREFLDYVAGKPSKDPFVRKVDEAVKIAKQNREWRREYMIVMMRDLENQEIGRQKGLKKGRREGRSEGRREGRREILASLVEQGLISVKTAAEQEGITEEEFLKCSARYNRKT